MIPNGIASISHIAHQQSAKTIRTCNMMEQRTTTFVGAFNIGAPRLVELLPEYDGGKIVIFGSNGHGISPTSPSMDTFPFRDARSLFVCQKAVGDAVQRSQRASGEVKKLTQKLELARCISGQLRRQKLNSQLLVDNAMSLLGRRYFLPAPGYDASFSFDEQEASFPLTDQKPREVNAGVDVIGTIEHSEPPATCDAGLLATQAEHDWVDQVPAQIQQQRVVQVEDVAKPSDENPTEPITFLEYHRYPESFRLALMNGAVLEPCRSALQEAGHDFAMLSGAKMAVHPWQYEEALAAITEKDIALRPCHVIVAQSLEYHVEASLADLSCRQGVRVRKRRALGDASVLPPEDDSNSSSSFQDAKGGASDHKTEGGDNGWAPLEAQRTFICASRRLRNPGSVTQSTTEAHQGGLNPRRAMLPPMSDE